MIFARAKWLLPAALLLLVVAPGPAFAGDVLKTASANGVTQTLTTGATSVNSRGFFGFKLGWSTRLAGGSGAAPAVTNVQLRLPKGVEINKKFLRGACNPDALAEAAKTNIDPSCSNFLGKGQLTMDFLPFTTNLVKADVKVFLAAGSEGSVARLAIVAIPDPKDAFVAANPIVANTRPVLVGSIYNDSSSGLGYRVDLPIDIDAPVLVSVREFNITFDKLVKRKGGKYWASPPCNGKAKFQAAFSYVGITKPITLNTKIPQRFKCAK